MFCGLPLYTQVFSDLRPGLDVQLDHRTQLKGKCEFRIGSYVETESCFAGWPFVMEQESLINPETYDFMPLSLLNLVVFHSLKMLKRTTSK